LRAHVERIFGTFASQLMPELIGRSFANSQERGDYPGEDLAALTDDDLTRLFTRFVVDIYHQTPHGGLNGETPANAWKRLEKEQGVTLPPDATALCSVFGVALNRKIDRHGIRAHGIHYLSPEIEEAYLRGLRSKVDVRVDPYDLTFVTVFLDGEWYPAHAVSDSVWGLSFAEWTEICRSLRLKHKQEAQITEAAVRRARKAIRRINADAMALRRLKPLILTTKDLERAERELFMSLTIKPSRHVPPVKDAPEGLGLLGDVIGQPQPDGGDPPETPDDTPAPIDGLPSDGDHNETPDDPQEQNATPKKGWGFRHG
jgi:putative transposase